MNFQSILALLGDVPSLIAAISVVIFIGVQLYKFFTLPPAKNQAEEMDRIKSLVRTGVMAVEQTCSIMAGPDKKSEAVRVIGQLLNDAGLQVSPVLLDALIEQAVLLLNQGKDPTATTIQPVVKPA